MLGRLLAEWTDRPIGCLFLVPLWHPVLMAEQIGTWPPVVRPVYRPGRSRRRRGQFRAMGAELGERAARLEEGILVVQALLRGETVDSGLWAVSGARIAPLPPEGTEWWIGGGVPKAIDRAARLGDCWYGNADLTPKPRPGISASIGRRAPATAGTPSGSRSARTCSSPTAEPRPTRWATPSSTPVTGDSTASGRVR